MSLVQAFVPYRHLQHRETIVQRLTDALLRAHGASENEAARQLTWVLVHEVPDGAWGVGGQPVASPRSLTIVREPAGSLREETREAIAREVHNAWCSVLGPELARLSVWLVIEEVPDGQWCVDGHVLRLPEIEELLDPRKGLEPVTIPESQLEPSGGRTASARRSGSQRNDAA